MRCSKAEGSVQSYLEGDMRGAELRAFEEHLSSCPTCQVRVEGYQELLGMLTALETVEVNEVFAEQVLSRLGRPFIPRIWIAVAAGLGVVVILATGFAALQVATPELLSPLGRLILSASLSLKTIGIHIWRVLAQSSILLRIMGDPLSRVSPLYWVGAGLWVVGFDLFCGWIIRRLRGRVIG